MGAVGIADPSLQGVDGRPYLQGVAMRPHLQNRISKKQGVFPGTYLSDTLCSMGHRVSPSKARCVPRSLSLHEPVPQARTVI